MSGKKGMKKYPEEIRKIVVGQIHAGESQRKLSRAYGISRYTIQSWCGLRPETNFVKWFHYHMVVQRKSRHWRTAKRKISEVFKHFKNLLHLQFALAVYVNWFPHNHIHYAPGILPLFKQEAFPADFLYKRILPMHFLDC